jgi:hypothetical protein
MKKMIMLFILVFVSFTGIGIANWNGPTILIEGEWGMADNQFGFEHGDSFDEYPSLDGILGDESIVLSDLVNKRTLVFKSNGTFKEKENWIEQPVAGGMIKYVHNKYLLGCCVQGYDAAGNLWTGSGNTYALTNKDGALISKVTVRPLELGKVTEKPVSSAKAKITVTYPDKIWSYIDVGRMPTYMRDKYGNLYGYGNTQVIRYTDCGKESASLMMPKKIEQEESRGPQVEPNVTVLEEYGSPVIAPNGDVYTWKRTPTAYSILTWVNDPNPPTNAPDMPESISLKIASTGINIFWKAVSQDPGCVTGYQLARSTTAGGPYTTLATVSPGTANSIGMIKYTDTTAEIGTMYYYSVRAVAGTVYSPYTAEVSGKR